MKPSLAMIAIFKNEADILEEWIDHHLHIGVDKFYLTNNASKDDYQSVLKKYGDRIVLFHDNRKSYTEDQWTDEVAAGDAIKNLQRQAYMNTFPLVQEDWTTVVDIDEFIYFRHGMTFEKMVNHFDDNNINQVLFPLKLFGSSGLEKQPASLIDSFVERATDVHVNCKQIVRTKSIKSIGLTACEITNGWTTNGTFQWKDNWFTNNADFHRFSNRQKKNNIGLPRYRRRSDEKFLDECFLLANHYLAQSKERFFARKKPRGLPCPPLAYNETFDEFWERRWNMTEDIKQKTVIDKTIQETYSNEKI